MTSPSSIVFVAVAVLFSSLSFLVAAAEPKDLHDVLHKHNLSGIASYWQGNPKQRLGSGANGFADPFFSRLLNMDSRYPVASNTKLYTTISLYQLQEKGLVNLTESIALYLDAEDFTKFGFPNITKYCPVLQGQSDNVCETVTFVDLLAMSAGIPDNLLHLMMPYPGSIAECVNLFINAPLLFTPGTQFFYSNPSFILAAYFIQKFSGLSLAAYFKEHIISVVGLENTYYDPYNGKFGLDRQRVGEYYQYLHPVATHEIVANGVCSSEYDLGSMNGAAGIVSTQADEALLYYTLFNFTDQSTMGQPLLQNPNSLLQIVQTRTFIRDGYYFAQGLFVNGNSLHSFPTVIQYEGEIVCSHTLNYYNLTVTPPTLVQVWSAVPVAYASEETVETLKKAKTGNFFDEFSALPQRQRLSVIAQEIVAKFP